MTKPMFRDDAYLQSAPAKVVEITDRGGIVLDQSIFYPTGGGQSGDRGWLAIGDTRVDIATTVKGEDARIVLVPGDPVSLPEVGAQVVQELDWDARHRMMRLHTALHLLSVVIPLPVTGGQITPEKGRLDFDMPEAPENRDALQDDLNALIVENHAVSEDWITDEALDANPGLVKTMSVMPPRGAGKIRLVRIGTGDRLVDLQPCGGTHVRTTAEIGAVRFGKIEKKGRQNRRVSIFLQE